MLLTIVSFLFVLAILVFVHEGGHFLAARHVGVRVQQFSLGLPPRAFGRRIGETEFLICWVPIGGYVKLEGQNIDDEDPSDPRNYASKTLLQRLYILAAGPVFNLALALLIMPLVFMLGVERPAYRHGPAMIGEVTADTPAAEAGFAAGDRIVGVGETETLTWTAVDRAAAEQSIYGEVVRFSVERGGTPLYLRLPSRHFNDSKPLGWRPLIPPVVGTVSPDSPAEAAGFQPGDRIVSIDGQALTRWEEISESIQRGQGEETTFEVERQGTRVLLTGTPAHIAGVDRWRIGISYPFIKEQYGPVEATLLGSQRLWDLTATTFVFLGRLVTFQASLEALGGPVKIGQFIGAATRQIFDKNSHSGLANFLFLMAFISLQLGIFNLLPIPALDGGHIFLLGLEKLKGKPLSPRLRERTQMIGFSLLLMLFAVVTYNDILQWATQ